MSFAKNLIDARKRMNYSSKELAQKIGISATAYSNYELGLREPKFDTLRKISTILNVSTDKLLNIDDSQRNEFYMEQGMEIMKELGFFKVLNPFDYHDYGEFNLCFARTEYEKVYHLPSKRELTSFVAFRKTEFIDIIENTDIKVPDKPVKTAQKDLLIEYIFTFLSCDGAYNDWLDDLDNVIEKSRALHPENWELFQKSNILKGDDLENKIRSAKGFLSRADADYIIKTKSDMSYLYNTELGIYAEDE